MTAEPTTAAQPEAVSPNGDGQGDTTTRPFGKGANWNYGIFLWSANQYQEVDLILPDGSRVHYVRTSPGTGWTDAVFE